MYVYTTHKELNNRPIRERMDMPENKDVGLKVFIGTLDEIYTQIAYKWSNQPIRYEIKGEPGSMPQLRGLLDFVVITAEEPFNWEKLRRENLKMGLFGLNERVAPITWIGQGISKQRDEISSFTPYILRRYDYFYGMCTGSVKMIPYYKIDPSNRTNLSMILRDNPVASEYAFEIYHDESLSFEPIRINPFWDFHKYMKQLKTFETHFPELTKRSRNPRQLFLQFIDPSQIPSGVSLEVARLCQAFSKRKELGVGSGSEDENRTALKFFYKLYEMYPPAFAEILIYVYRVANGLIQEPDYVIVEDTNDDEIEEDEIEEDD